ncbi:MULTISPECIES: hypothetical protein [unclassified Saccharicrinis]|uniref:hypothetical protein n=1 Tax=unclassified Saccharicrinis TaxID=2646859 RepID=UPI003D327D4A
MVTEYHIGIEDHKAENIRVFPNLLKNKAQVMLGQGGYGRIAIYNLIGSKLDLISVNVFDVKAELDFSEYANGFYLIACEKDNNVQLIKVINEE